MSTTRKPRVKPCDRCLCIWNTEVSYGFIFADGVRLCPMCVREWDRWIAVRKLMLEVRIDRIFRNIPRSVTLTFKDIPTGKLEIEYKNGRRYELDPSFYQTKALRMVEVSDGRKYIIMAAAIADVKLTEEGLFMNGWHYKDWEEFLSMRAAKITRFL